MIQEFAVPKLKKKKESFVHGSFGFAKVSLQRSNQTLISKWDLCHYKSRSLVVKEFLLKYEGESGNFHSVLRGENYESKHKGFVDAV